MKTFNEWKELHLADNPEDENLGHKEFMDMFNEYIRENLDSVPKSNKSIERKRKISNENTVQPSVVRDDRIVKLLESQDKKLSEITFFLKRISWQIFVLFLLAFGIPFIISVLFG